MFERTEKARKQEYEKNKQEKEQKDELLIHGFNRYIQNDVLSTDTIIPSDINDLLLQFYHIPLAEPEKINGCALRRMVKELRDMEDDPPHFCSAKPNGDDIFSWTATMMGPENTPYFGGRFFLKMDFGMDYPFKVLF